MTTHVHELKNVVIIKASPLPKLPRDSMQSLSNSYQAYFCRNGLSNSKIYIQMKKILEKLR